VRGRSARLAGTQAMAPNGASRPGGANGAGASHLDAPRAMLVYSHSWLPGQVDGVAVRMMAHVKSLASRGTKVVVVTPDFVPPGEELERKPMSPIPGVEHITLATMRTPVYRKNFCMSFSFGNLLKLIDVIQRVKPDYVHGTQEASLQVLATACIWCGVPLVISMHTDVIQITAADQSFSDKAGRSSSALAAMVQNMHKYITCVCTHWGYRNWALANAFFFPVSAHARSMLRTAGVGDVAIAPDTWGPMVDSEQFRPDLPKDAVAEARRELTFGIPGAYLLVYCGRVTAEKDIQFLVDSLARHPKNVVLALVGPGSMCEQLKPLHGKDHRVHCTGEFVSRDKVALYMCAADCCVSASTMETVGFTAMEALSSGTPFLAANAQGFAEHLKHGSNARLWTPHDKASFDRELSAMMATSRTGNWSPEALRASMSTASVEACTDRAVGAYLHARHRGWHSLRLASAVFFFFLNWMVTLVMQ